MDLAILIKNKERVSFGFEDDTDGLSTIYFVNKQSSKQHQRATYSS